MNVFIGGSRAVSRLNAPIRARIDELIERRLTILIGDANGADKAVQRHLAERGYPNVVVFCVERCRNNVGAWPTRRVEPPSGRKDFAYYSTKDEVMSHEANCGVMFWDGKSKGTLRNILDLVRAGKRTLVYFAPTRDFIVLANENNLQDLLARCDKRCLESAARALGSKVPLGQPHLPVVFR